MGNSIVTGLNWEVIWSFQILPLPFSALAEAGRRANPLCFERNRPLLRMADLLFLSVHISMMDPLVFGIPSRTVIRFSSHKQPHSLLVQIASSACFWRRSKKCLSIRSVHISNSPISISLFYESLYLRWTCCFDCTQCSKIGTANPNSRILKSALSQKLAQIWAILQNQKVVGSFRSFCRAWRNLDDFSELRIDSFFQVRSCLISGVNIRSHTCESSSWCLLLCKIIVRIWWKVCAMMIFPESNLFSVFPGLARRNDAFRWFPLVPKSSKLSSVKWIKMKMALIQFGIIQNLIPLKL